MHLRGLRLTTGLGLAAALALATNGVAFAQERYTPPGKTYHSAVKPEQRRAYFGELHLHTAMSFDAWTFGTKVTPDQAYKFARGETVMVPAIQVAVEQGGKPEGLVPARRAWPLDFTAVTDHSEYLGSALQLDNPNSRFSKTAFGQKIIASGRQGFIIGEAAIYGPPSQERKDLKAAADDASGWAVEMKAANDNYIPGKFTTFVAYEWTATPGNGVHMHRNVIFNSDHAPSPFTALESNHPEDLWKYLASVRKQGIDVIAIPHNSNLSDGHDFDWNMSDGRPINEGYALDRALNEPLVEIAQTKGSSDTTPELSPNDEFANFEIKDRIYDGEDAPKQHGSYVREAYGRGLIIQSKVGANPFKMGVVGGSDIHNGLSVSDENGYGGGISGLDPKTMILGPGVARRMLDMPTKENPDAEVNKKNDPIQNSGAAITGVWAEENTRDAIFAALKRKETFATSGVRLRLRMFGGWDFEPDMIQKADWVAHAYAEGVPMGSDMPAASSAAKGPRFVVQAMKDPDGANLDRIQIIKIWLDGKDYKERVFDVSLSGGRHDDPRTGKAPSVGNTVDLTTGKYQNTIGATMLTAFWRDPTFNAKTPAVYYARALEIPTPRWSTLQAISHHFPIPKGAAPTIQERAWTSPIWFTPPKG